jgi:hypothetical protein
MPFPPGVRGTILAWVSHGRSICILRQSKPRFRSNSLSHPAPRL